MGEVTHEQANLLLRLYELRREPRLREAREWYFKHFIPATPEDAMRICPPNSEESVSMRMVTSYWEMVAGMANRGLIEEDFFFENTGEQWAVWERLKPIVPAFRAMFKNPNAYKQLEENVRRMDAWKEKNAPGSVEAMRQMMAMMAAKPKEQATKA
ncbi:MAG TPA: hypothetical protein VGD60_11705 [Candidatus Acidoferrales bacterium]